MQTPAFPPQDKQRLLHITTLSDALPWNRDVVNQDARKAARVRSADIGKHLVAYNDCLATLQAQFLKSSFVALRARLSCIRDKRDMGLRGKRLQTRRFVVRQKHNPETARLQFEEKGIHFFRRWVSVMHEGIVNVKNKASIPQLVQLIVIDAENALRVFIRIELLKHDIPPMRYKGHITTELYNGGVVNTSPREAPHMNTNPELIVMLTHNDRTVSNAQEIFEACKNSKARFWGFKEEPLPLEDMKRLYSVMKKCGKTTFLEVVAYTDAECFAGAEMAVECGVDVLLGTMYSDSIRELCEAHGLKYMPFIGKVSGRPSVLEGSLEEMIDEARKALEKGVYGFDLLGYRYTGDAAALNKAFVQAIDAPVCLAGSINSYQRLDEVKEASPWAFTIGGAFFEEKFGTSFEEQINAVCDYIAR